MKEKLLRGTERRIEDIESRFQAVLKQTEQYGPNAVAEIQAYKPKLDAQVEQLKTELAKIGQLQDEEFDAAWKELLDSVAKTEDHLERTREIVSAKYRRASAK